MKEEIKGLIAKLNNGEAPKGYKKTDIGIFPKDWVTDKTFGDLFDFYGHTKCIAHNSCKIIFKFYNAFFGKI